LKIIKIKIMDRNGKTGTEEQTVTQTGLILGPDQIEIKFNSFI